MPVLQDPGLISWDGALGNADQDSSLKIGMCSQGWELLKVELLQLAHSSCISIVCFSEMQRPGLHPRPLGQGPASCV